ncbi:MAG: sugar transferase [Chlorobiaceae bacterium]
MKRLFDLVVSFSGLIVLSPILIVVALIVRIKHGPPVLFRQIRPGIHNNPFTIFKFRTMTDVKDKFGNQMADMKRVTRLGSFLRSSSLDELPEIINVLKGDMSIVGPRPLLMEYLSLYSPEQKRRHEVKPGITGWAQIKGRNSISWEEKFKLDLWYIDNHSLWLDIRILVITIINVFMRKGINYNSIETMPLFTGPQFIQSHDE